MKSTTVFAFVSCLAVGCSAFANSSTALEPGRFNVTPSFIYQSFDEFYAGDQRVDTPGGGEKITRESYRLYFDYGLVANWSLDLSIGYYRTESGVEGPFTESNQDGLGDTYLGVRHALLTQDAQGLDLAVRVGGTLPGDYETGQLSAPGDDAWGADFKVLAGKTYGQTRLEGTLGYFLNEGAVPETFLAAISVSQEIFTKFWVGVGYTYFDADGDLDIGGLGFSPDRLREVSELGQVIDASLAYADDGGRYYRVFISQLVDGENIGREQTIGASVSFGF